MTTTKLDCLDIVTHNEAVEQFVERLATFSRVDWLSVAAVVTKTASSRVNATEALDRLIAQRGRAFDAWSIGDDVETAFHCSMGGTSVIPSPRDCASLRIARESATKAAVALFVGSLLPAADFEVLYRPFASLAPQPAGSHTPRPAAVRPPLRLVDLTSRERRHGTACVARGLAARVGSSARAGVSRESLPRPRRTSPQSRREPLGARHTDLAGPP